MQYENQLYLSNEFPQYEELPVKAPAGGIVVSMCKAKDRGGVLLPQSNRMLPDVGTVISVGERHSKNYAPGDKVAVKPGVGLYYYDYEGTGHDLRFIQDVDNDECFQSVPESVPIKLTEAGPKPVVGWTMVEKNRVSATILTVNEISDGYKLDGKRILTKKVNPLTFRNPEDWGIKPESVLIGSEDVLAWA